jgi:hypothetical protein
MTIPKGIALILFCAGLGGHGIAEAGFASKLADTHRFRLSYAFGTMERSLRGSGGWVPGPFDFEGQYEFIRAGYGITDRLRLSLDAFGYRQGSIRTGDGADHVAAFGGCLQGKLVTLGRNRAVEASGGYWEAHESHVYDSGIEEAIFVERAFSLVLRQEPNNRFGGYIGPIYNHFRHEDAGPPINYSGWERLRTITRAWASHRDFGLVGGIETALANHLRLNAESTYTGDWGLTGEIGWEF